MAKKNFYAIKDGKGVKNKVVKTWDECKRLVDGYSNAKYKGFSSEEEAYEYLGVKKNKDDNKKPLNKLDKEILVLENIEKDLKEKFANKKISNDKKDSNKNFHTVKVSLSPTKYKKFARLCNELNLSEEAVLKSLILDFIK